MAELLIPLIIFSVWTGFSIIYIFFFKDYQTKSTANKKSFWNNQYIFDTIPNVFPTLGIFCTALGITIGIWDFNTIDIQSSIPQLLKGLRLAFVATMAGIIGLIIFQKVNAIVQKIIDDDPNRPRKQTDEISAIAELSHAITELKKDNEKQFEKMIKSFGDDLETKVSTKLSSLESEIIAQHKTQIENRKSSIKGMSEIKTAIDENKNAITLQLANLKEDQNETAKEANNNTSAIIKAMNENNKATAKKFEEFSELMKKNNTEALVGVMKQATEQFNAQMSELINRLVKENFNELNNSVKSLNTWQLENKEQIQKLTAHFEKTTEMFNLSAITLKEVAVNTKAMTDDNSKLSQIVQELKKVMIDDGKFQEITNKLTKTIETLQSTTESFDETTHKLNDWVKTEKNFKEAAQILITKLEEFRNLNGDVWDKYRKEMSKAVSIVKDTSTSLSENLENINADFYNRLNDTLINLDECIQRMMSGKPFSRSTTPSNNQSAPSYYNQSAPSSMPAASSSGNDDLPF